MEAGELYGTVMLSLSILLLGVFLLDRLWRRGGILLPAKERGFLDRGGMELQLFLGAFLLFFLLNNHKFVFYNNYLYDEHFFIISKFFNLSHLIYVLLSYMLLSHIFCLLVLF